MRAIRLAAVLLSVAACSSPPAAEAPPAPVAPAEAAPVGPPEAPPPAAPVAREYGFDPSPEDRAALGAAGFAGTAAVPPGAGYERGLRIAGVTPGSGLEAAGVMNGDLLVAFEDLTFAATDADPIGRLRAKIAALRPDSDARLVYFRAGEGVREVVVRLGRRPPDFDTLATPASWFAPRAEDPAAAALVALATAQDGGAARLADTLLRNRRRYEKRDAFRLRQVMEAHLHPAATERLAREISDEVRRGAAAAARAASGGLAEDPESAPGSDELERLDLEGLVGRIAAFVERVDGTMRDATSAWTAEDRAFVGAQAPRLLERLAEEAAIADDADAARERGNRRLVALLAKALPERIAVAAEETTAFLDAVLPRLAELAAKDGRPGLLASRETRAGRVEVWGGGHQRHTARCAFRFDLEGDDDYLDCAGRADLAQPVSIDVDWSGRDLYGATSPFSLGGALGGVAVLLDLDGDDEYLGRDAAMGVGVAGFGLLEDRGGRDVYHALHVSQGVGLQGAGVLVDDDGDDLYTGQRLCQGVGLPGGVGALRDWSGNDRYVCTGRYGSEYGEPGLFSGWGQGCGLGFRHVASGGIGLLHDLAGDDVYEAGNFSQGGGYFYAWGILRDDAGADRYIGARYAQGFAAHQAVGTFLEGAGDDLYQSHAGVAQGLSWDETMVVFHDLGGNDTYRTAGFSLASAAHNGMVLFFDDGGDDVYADVPGKASSNDYHGGKSFALFVDSGGGRDVYGAAPEKEWNGRTAFRDEGAYTIDR